MKTFQKIFICFAMIMVIGHNVLEHACHEDDLFVEQQNSLWEFMQDVFAFGGGDEHLDHQHISKCNKCKGLIFDFSWVATAFERILLLDPIEKVDSHPPQVYLSNLRPVNYIRATHSLRGSPTSL